MLKIGQLLLDSSVNYFPGWGTALSYNPPPPSPKLSGVEAILIRELASGLTLKVTSLWGWMMGLGDDLGREDTPGYRLFGTVNLATKTVPDPSTREIRCHTKEGHLVRQAMAPEPSTAIPP